MEAKNASPYKRGADNGIIMGIYLCLMFAAWSQMVYDTPTSAMLSFTGLCMSAGVPIVLYILLRFHYVADKGTSQFSAVWLEGILTFVFGGLISTIAGYIYVRIINPGYMDELVAWMLNSLKLAVKSAPADQAAEYEQMVKNFKAMIDQGLMPSAISLMLNLMWVITFFGSILSLFVTMIVRAIKVRK